MNFTTNFKKHPRKQETYTNKEQKIYKVDFDKKTGKRKLVVDKTVNVYEKIQEYRDELNISNILKRYDLDMMQQLKKEEAKLIDLTNLPENLMQTMEILDNAKYAFDRQSKTIKDKFNNDFKQFIAASENGQLAKMLNEELKVSAEKFDTSKMTNYQGQELRNYTQPIQNSQNVQEMQGNGQFIPNNNITGGNLNV